MKRRKMNETNNKECNARYITTQLWYGQTSVYICMTVFVQSDCKYKSNREKMEEKKWRSKQKFDQKNLIKGFFLRSTGHKIRCSYFFRKMFGG